MRKILFLALVLCVSSISAAGLQLSVNDYLDMQEINITPWQIVTIGIYTDTPAQDQSFYLGIEYNGGSHWLQGTENVYPALGGGTFYYEQNPDWINITTGINASNGLLFDVVFDPISYGDSVITLFDDSKNTIFDSIVIYHFPEPASLLLLALGGLALRLKKP
jgi:hypothetical protein